MIRYSLTCGEGHSFEGWFASSDAYDKQHVQKLVLCPVCDSNAVEKALMAPSVATARKRETAQRETLQLAANVPEKQEVVALLRKVRNHLTENADYVGPKFAEEARRIHYNETEKRGIYGEATADEVRGLVDEGIEFRPLPTLPEDQN